MGVSKLSRLERRKLVGSELLVSRYHLISATSHGARHLQPCKRNVDSEIIAMARAGGIQTRAILIDLPLYFSAHSLPPLDPLSFPSSTPITFKLLQSAMTYFEIVSRVGDVLLVRTGFEDVLLDDVKALQDGSRKESLLKGSWAGVEANEETLHWIWETGFLAVGSDNPTFEEWSESFWVLPLIFRKLRLMGLCLVRSRLPRHEIPSNLTFRNGNYDW